jgi:dTDP-3-amino-3,4,6-trideoxy-alpha-D-glucose transaminase
MVVTDDDDVADRARALRSYGQRGSDESAFEGWNSRLDALQAAALGAKLPHLDRWNGRRRSLARRYDRALGRSDVVLPVEGRGRRHVYHLYVVRSRRRDELRRRLAERGVEVLVHYPRPVHRHPAYVRLGGRAGSLAASERLASEVLSLPLYPQLSDDEVDAVAAAVCE